MSRFEQLTTLSVQPTWNIHLPRSTVSLLYSTATGAGKVAGQVSCQAAERRKYLEKGEFMC